MVTKDLIWGGNHTMQYIDDVSQNSTFEGIYNFIKQCHKINFKIILRRINDFVNK